MKVFGFKKHAKNVHNHIQEHGHKWALVMALASMVMMFYPYFSSNAQMSGNFVNYINNVTHNLVEDQLTFDWEQGTAGTGTVEIAVETLPDEFEQITTLDISEETFTYLLPNTGTFNFKFTAIDEFTQATGELIYSVLYEGTVPDPEEEEEEEEQQVEPIAVSLTYDPATATNQDVTVILSADDQSPLTISGNNESPEYTFTDNGDFTFEYTDASGFTGVVVAIVDYIDKIAPTAQVTYSTTSATSDPVIATIGNFSETNVSLIDTTAQYTFTQNGSYTFNFEDGVGNTGAVTATVTWIQQTQTPPPVVLAPITATVQYSTTGSTTGTVVATVTGFAISGTATTGVTITNNSGANTYTFTQNGNFTFNLTHTNGNTGTATATVAWISSGTNQQNNNPPVSGSNNICDGSDYFLVNPLNNSIVGNTFNIVWDNYNNDCNPDQIITIQLRDHNQQWVTLGTGELDSTGFVFNSKVLANTGLYTITGVYLSGSVYSYTGTSGQQLTGVYTGNVPYIVYTGSYTGSYTGYATGYMIRLLSASGTNILSGTYIFTVDNIPPTITGVSLQITGTFYSGYYGGDSVVTIAFTGSEQLSGVQLAINNTNVSSSGVVATGYIYTYTASLATVSASGNLAYTITFKDLAGNTGALSVTSAILINTVKPQINNFAITGSYASGIKLAWNTNKETKYSISHVKSGTNNTTNYNGTTFGTSHVFTMPTVQTGSVYNFTISTFDRRQNIASLSGTITVSNTGAIQVGLSNNNNVLQLSSQVEAKLYREILKNEIEKFQECRDEININETEIMVNGDEIVLEIPDMDKASSKTIVQAFSLLLINKLKDADLSADTMEEVVNRVNNFFIILKLLRDDEGSCQQNMSAYYINQFEKIMQDTELMFVE